MEPIFIPLYLYLFLHIVTLLAAGQSPPIYTPVDVITLDCGNLGEHSSNYDSRIWIGDINSTLSPIQDGESNVTSQFRKAPPSSSQSASQVPYTTARLSYSEFTYNTPLSPGKKFVRLYFNPASYQDFHSSNSIFSVTASDYIILKDFRAYITADGAYSETPLIREFCVNIETEDSLNITFTPSKDAYAFINGIEIVSMPTNLYTTSVRSIGSDSPYAVESRKALDMVYRINIGGKPINITEDTGVYRKWDAADYMYLDGLSKRYSVLAQNNTIELKFVETPEYTAPEEVYKTGRSMGMNKTINKSYNLTWAFPVDSNFSYLVRLHFCEFESDITKSGEQTFVIYIANQIAEQGADVILWSGGNGIPTYRDYMLLMLGPGSQKKVNLTIAFQALQQDLSAATLNGLEIFKLIDPKSQLASEADPKITSNGKSFPLLALIAGVVSGILVFSVLGYLVFRRRWKVKDSGFSQKRMKFTTTPGSSYPCRCISLAEIKAATKNFSDAFIIGAGGFGNVYKGCIDGGATPVAIKRLKSESSQGVNEFETEIEMLSQLRHRHLVSLIGYCTDKREMILVYDYMAQGTLRDHLYHTNNQPLPWEQRLQICIGAARGLQYLHNGAKGTIIHRDVKSTNILLDDKLVAKVSDFGLSKGTTNMSKTHISTIVKGSFGYLDPEYYRRQRLTEKSDVYSFGVVLCEVLCARPAVIHEDKTEPDQVNLAEWAKSCHENGELDRIIDPCLRGKIAAECLNIFVDVAIRCMHDDRTQRPSMNDVVRGLELALELKPSAEADIRCTKPIGETETSSSEQSCAINNSIICISETIFSEINNSTGR